MANKAYLEKLEREKKKEMKDYFPTKFEMKIMSLCQKHGYKVWPVVVPNDSSSYRLVAYFPKKGKDVPSKEPPFHKRELTYHVIQFYRSVWENVVGKNYLITEEV